MLLLLDRIVATQVTSDYRTAWAVVGTSFVYAWVPTPLQTFRPLLNYRS
jgi:phage gpG-like protein